MALLPEQFLRCNVCFQQPAPISVKKCQAPEMNLLSCKHLMCDQCLVKRPQRPRGQEATANACPLCKKPGIRSLPLDGSAKLPARAAQCLFGSPDAMFDELIEMIDFQKELYDLNMKNLEQLVKQKEREAQQELESKQAEGTKLEEKIASATGELEKMKQSNQELERRLEFMRKAAAPVSNASYDMPGRITGPEVYRNQVPQDASGPDMMSPDEDGFYSNPVSPTPDVMDKDVMNKIAGALKTPKWTNKNQEPDPRGAGATAMPVGMENNNAAGDRGFLNARSPTDYYMPPPAGGRPAGAAGGFFTPAPQPASDFGGEGGFFSPPPNTGGANRYDITGISGVQALPPSGRFH